MTFYILFVLFVSSFVLLQYFYPNKSKYIEIGIFGVMVFVAGFRDRIGTDYDSYVSWYLHKTRDDDFEIGFVALMKLFRALHLSPQFLFFFFSFFTYLFIYLGIKKYTENSGFALLFYILIPSLFLTSFTLVRQEFSVAISFYAFYYLINRKYYVFFILMVIGVSIHRTCLLPVVAFLFLDAFVDRIKRIHLIIALMVSLILSKINFVSVFSILFREMRYGYYFSDLHIVPVSGIKIFILNGVGVFILFYYEKLIKTYPNHKYLLVLYFFSIIILNVVSPIQDLSRFYTYFRVFEIIIVADLIFLELKTKRILLFGLFYLMYFATFVNGLQTDFEIKNEKMPKYIPYHNFIIEAQKK